MNKHQNKVLDGIKDAYKPKLFVPIYLTLIALGPYGHLWYDVVRENYDRLLLLVLLSSISLISIGAVWTFYITALIRYFDEKNEFLNDPDIYVE